MSRPTLPPFVSPLAAPHHQTAQALQPGPIPFEAFLEAPAAPAAVALAEPLPETRTAEAPEVEAAAPNAWQPEAVVAWEDPPRVWIEQAADSDVAAADAPAGGIAPAWLDPVEPTEAMGAEEPEAEIELFAADDTPDELRPATGPIVLAQVESHTAIDDWFAAPPDAVELPSAPRPEEVADFVTALQGSADAMPVSVPFVVETVPAFEVCARDETVDSQAKVDGDTAPEAGEAKNPVELMVTHIAGSAEAVRHITLEPSESDTMEESLESWTAPHAVAASVLESVAARVRAGQIHVPSGLEGGSDASVLAAVLASMLVPKP